MSSIASESERGPGPAPSPAIEPLAPGEVAPLGRFLAEGFGPSGPLGPHAPEVLLWKYFDPCGAGGMPRSFIAREAGAIVGHAGLCPSAFVGPGIAAPVPTFHLIDWLGSTAHRGVGSALMRHVHRLTPTQYAFGSTAAARRSLDKAGYVRTDDVPVFRKVLRAGYRMRVGEGSRAKAAMAAARDAARLVARRDRPPSRRLELLRAHEFAEGIRDLNASYRAHATFTERSPERLNHLLRHPAHGLEGYLLLEGGRPRGLALLNVLESGRARVGRIVECLVEGDSPDLHAEGIAALVESLRGRRVDAIFGCASTPWGQAAYRDRGFDEAFRLECRVRDPEGLVPRDAPFHWTYLEADYSYLP